MRIVTWNVNSLKVRLPRVLELLAELEPDVLCLQLDTGLRDAYRVACDYRKGSKPSDHAPLVADLS